MTTFVTFCAPDAARSPTLSPVDIPGYSCLRIGLIPRGAEVTRMTTLLCPDTEFRTSLFWNKCVIPSLLPHLAGLKVRRCGKASKSAKSA